MDDLVRPTSEEFRKTYEAAFTAWSRLHLSTVENPTLPASYLSPRDVFRQHPYFPPGLRLKRVQRAGHDGPRFYATGHSTWGSPPCKDGVDFSSFRQPLEIEVATSSPVTLSIAEPTQKHFGNPPWFFRSDTNYVPILALAWAYILSARWTELLPERCSLSYTDSQAKHKDDLPEQPPVRSTSYIDIGAASPEETRWWAAVLAPRRGWQSTIRDGQLTSPWSISLQAGHSFVLQTASPSSPSSHCSPVSFTTASLFLDHFCQRHNIIDQSYAALAAVLLLPCFGKDRAFQFHLSHPKLDIGMQLGGMAISPQGIPSEYQRYDWVHEEHHLDRLLTLSCNIRAVRPMLLSAFYEPWVDCNLVTPWLQGTVAAIDAVLHSGSHVLGRMLMEREPSVAFLWVGATILGLQETLLKDVRRGHIPTDLHSAVWSGTLQSFLQQPVSNPLVIDGCISRADECRLLFLSQSGQHARVPICQWRPFGVTPVGDVDLEVRAHEECGNHWLQYRGFSWDCANGVSRFQPSGLVTGHRAPLRRSSGKYLDGRKLPIIHDGLNRDKEVISENATRSIFGWLRFDGHASHERGLWDHEWFDVHESDEDEDEDEDGDGSAPETNRDFTHISEWLSGLDRETVVLE
ncbi:hypothetical protein F5Y17DRAFT_453338 [Xylariaceae sp. FL0594]|nr:hypothetical protein F5Y17DRAFT_453338 [Xylariaceae sp. FL0594]